MCDVTLGEDASQVRTGSGLQVMAALRNIAICVAHTPTLPPLCATTPPTTPKPSPASACCPDYEKTLAAL